MTAGKRAVIAEVVRQLRNRRDRMLMAGKSAEAYAKDDESRPEDRYDTRGLEASYLAAGQARQVEELTDAIRTLEDWEPASFDEGSSIGLGALVEAEVEGNILFYLLAPAGGGAGTAHLGCPLTVLSPESPLALRLTGLRSGDTVDSERLTVFGVE